MHLANYEQMQTNESKSNANAGQYDAQIRVNVVCKIPKKCVVKLKCSNKILSVNTVSCKISLFTFVLVPVILNFKINRISLTIMFPITFRLIFVSSNWIGKLNSPS